MFYEDTTSQNDEHLEDNQTNDDTSTENNGEAESEGSESDSVTLTRAELEDRERAIRREQDKRWKDRLKGFEDKDDSKESSKNSKESVKEVDNPTLDRLDRVDLRAEGIRDKVEQDIIIKYAKIEGLDVVEALDSSIVKAALKDHRNKSATPSPSRRTATATKDDAGYWAQQMEKGIRPPTAELRAKARDYLAKNKR